MFTYYVDAVCVSWWRLGRHHQIFVSNAAPEVDEEKCNQCCRCVKSCAAFTGEGCCTSTRERRAWG